MGYNPNVNLKILKAFPKIPFLSKRLRQYLEIPLSLCLWEKHIGCLLNKIMLL